MFTVTEEPIEDSPFKDADLEDATPKVKSKPDTELIIKSLTKTYASIGVFVRLANKQDGLIIVRNAEELAESWRMLLDSDTKIRRIMKNMIRSSGWGTVLAAHVMVAIPIIENHEVSVSHLFKRAEQNGDDDQ